MQTLGLRHVALNVLDPEKTAEFYQRVLRMEREWQPDADNIYLTSGGLDNLAIHRATHEIHGQQRLDHLGFAVPTAEDVDAWHAHAVAQGAEIVAVPKQHRDGARSFYLRDVDGTVVQVIHHLPIAARERRGCGLT